MSCAIPGFPVFRVTAILALAREHYPSLFGRGAGGNPECNVRDLKKKLTKKEKIVSEYANDIAVLSM